MSPQYYYKDILEIAYYGVIILGVPAGLYKFYRAKKREQQDREYGTYDSLDDKYLEFQRLCFENPELDIFDVKDDNCKPLDQFLKKKQLIAFTMLFSIFERDYLMNLSSRMKSKQWNGWNAYMDEYLPQRKLSRRMASKRRNF